MKERKNVNYIVPNFNIEYAIGINNDLHNYNGFDKFCFDFKRMTNFDPFPMLVCGIVMRNFRHENNNVPFSISWKDERINYSYPAYMGYFEFMAPGIGIGRMPGLVFGNNNYIPITPLDIKKMQNDKLEKKIYLQMQDVIEEKANELASILDRGDCQLHKLLSYIIREIIRNCPEHAETNLLYICGQYWPSYNLAEIAIVDEGIGIYNSLIKNDLHREYIHNSIDALRCSIKPGISENHILTNHHIKDSIWENSGYGLYIVSEICKITNGMFCMISGNSYIKITNQDTNLGESNFNGTAIGIRIHTNSINDSQKMIDEIVAKGREESKYNDNAIKLPSHPSKSITI